MASATAGGTSGSTGNPARGRFAGARHDDKLDQSRQRVGLPPAGQRRHVIRADEVKQRRVRKPTRVIPHRVNRVGHAATVQFLFVHLAARPAGQGQPQQTRAHRAGRRPVLGFERRLRRRNETEPVQAQFLQRRPRHEQMPQMHRIKRAAEQPQLHGRGKGDRLTERLAARGTG